MSELNELSDKTLKILETFRKNIILEIIKDISSEFLITDSNNKTITLDDLKNIYLNSKKIRCVAVNNNGTQCKKNNYQNNLYCKIHLNQSNFKEKKQEEKVEQQKREEEGKDEFVNSKNLTKILIDDSFYFLDCKYIYDLKSLEKVGFLNSKGEYILTDDPFLLNI